MNGPFLTSDKQARPFTTDNDLHDKRNHLAGKPEYIQMDIDTLAGGLSRKTANLWRPNNAAKKVYNYNKKYNTFRDLTVLSINLSMHIMEDSIKKRQ